MILFDFCMEIKVGANAYENVVTDISSNNHCGINENDTEHKKVAKWTSYFFHSIVELKK